MSKRVALGDVTPGGTGVAHPGPGPARAATLRRALRLEYMTVGWNVAEGAIGVAAAVAARSVALLGFGVDSFVESASGAVLVWRLLAERRGLAHAAVERIDRRAHRLVGGSLLLLAAYVAGDAALTLWHRETPHASPVGIALTSISLVAMRVLARAKRGAARELGSRALAADAFQTTACWWLSLVTLAGLGLNAAFGWWWADPAVAFVVAGLIGFEGSRAWRGEACEC
jgi:divalent metal cation (Fe/Co/Zn/Cd) transporter